MAIKFKGVQVIFLGRESKKNKDEKEYYLVNMMDSEGSILQFYVSPSNHNLMHKINEQKQMSRVVVDFEISSFQMKPQLNIIGIDKA